LISEIDKIVENMNDIKDGFTKHATYK